MEKDSKIAVDRNISSRHCEFNRQEIESLIYNNLLLIKKLREENIQLRRESILLSDDTQQFEEKSEDVIVSKRPKKKEKLLVGRIHWVEEFKDESSGVIVTVKMSRIVRINGEWQ